MAKDKSKQTKEKVTEKENSQKMQAVQMAVEQIQKQFGQAYRLTQYSFDYSKSYFRF